MAVSISDVVAFKRLVAAGNDKIFYEDLGVGAGTMIELAASDGDIDTSDQLNIFEAYQKVFVINGTNLKVADFRNTKLTVSTLTTAPTRGSIVTQVGSTATMVVDFVNAAKTAIYGRTTSGTFVTTGGNTLSGGSMDPEDEVPSAVAEASTTPHWYDYEVYPGGSSGSLPTAAYLGCLFLGSIYLAGDPDYPNQWYKSRQTNPFDYAYVSLDAQSAVAGSDPNVGEMGDIIRALIPYSNDYLLFGCADSMWYMVGDPASGGKPFELDLTTGVFGAQSWCSDGQGTIYFWGTNGVYKTRIPGKPECISEIALPDLVKDEGANPSTYRITMGYDRRRNGILICITKLADGTNSNYFYSINDAGFFPETYPEECGVYSLFYYAANDNAYKDLLIGCKDGYIRKFTNNINSDDIGGSNELIDSYVTFGPIKLGKENEEGVLASLTPVTCGSRVGTLFVDSSPLVCKVWTGLAADDIIEGFNLNTTPKMAATIITPGRGRGSTIRREVRGIYAGVRLGNSVAAQTWGLEHLNLSSSKVTGKV